MMAMLIASPNGRLLTKPLSIHVSNSYRCFALYGRIKTFFFLRNLREAWNCTVSLRLAGHHLNASCAPNRYLCRGSGVCLNFSRLCDVVPDCPDASDEGEHCSRLFIDDATGRRRASCVARRERHRYKTSRCVDSLAATSRPRLSVCGCCLLPSSERAGIKAQLK